MPIPRVRFTIRTIMIVVIVLAVVLGLVIMNRRLYPPHDGFINDPSDPSFYFHPESNL